MNSPKWHLNYISASATKILRTRYYVIQKILLVDISCLPYSGSFLMTRAIIIGKRVSERLETLYNILLYQLYQAFNILPQIFTEYESAHVLCLLKVIRMFFFKNHNKSFTWHLGDYEKHNFFHLKACERRNFGFVCFYGCVVCPLKPVYISCWECGTSSRQAPHARRAYYTSIITHKDHSFSAHITSNRKKL